MPKKRTFTISKEKDLGDILFKINDEIKDLDLREDDRIRCLYGLREAIRNSLNVRFRKPVVIDLFNTKKQVTFCVEDNGPGFNHNYWLKKVQKTIKKADKALRLEQKRDEIAPAGFQRKTYGLITMVRAFDKVQYSNNGSHVRLKRILGDKGQSCYSINSDVWYGLHTGVSKNNQCLWRAQCPFLCYISIE